MPVIWDVGHQCYPHKILTGRRDRIPHPAPWRRPFGLHAPHGERIRSFGAAHSSTSHLRRPGLGMAVART